MTGFILIASCGHTIEMCIEILGYEFFFLNNCMSAAKLKIIAMGMKTYELTIV